MQFNFVKMYKPDMKEAKEPIFSQDKDKNATHSLKSVSLSYFSSWIRPVYNYSL